MTLDPKIKVRITFLPGAAKKVKGGKAGDGRGFIQPRTLDATLLDMEPKLLTFNPES
jgi:hypothetical protein